MIGEILTPRQAGKRLGLCLWQRLLLPQNIYGNRLATSFQNKLPPFTSADIQFGISTGFLTDQNFARTGIGRQPGCNIYRVSQGGHVNNAAFRSYRPKKSQAGVYPNPYGYP